MPNFEDRLRRFGNGALYDAFGRNRVSEPYTLWDSKLLGDNRAIFWDDAETSGSGTASNYTPAHSSVKLSVSADTAGTRVRQTKNRFNYQPGKSQLIFVTCTPGAAAAGIKRRVGYFDDSNGVFFEQDGDVLYFVRRSKRSGAVVDTRVAQSEWNVARDYDRPFVLNPDRSQIFVFDMEWLGVGTIHCGLVYDGIIYYLHEFNHANRAAGVYMTTPNLPIRYEISNDGNGGAAEIECICSSVMSEGGQTPTGQTIGLTTVPTHVDASTADTTYAIIGIKLKSTHLDNVAKIKQVQMLNEGNTDFYWSLRLNPTVAGTFTYADVANTPLQAAYGATANTVTGGFTFANGLSTSATVAVDVIENLLYLGSKIDGTADEIVLCCTPLSANADIQAAAIVEFN